MHSIQQSGAADLREAKRQVIDSLAGPDGPAWGRDWYRDYSDEGSGNGLVTFLDAASAAVHDSRINKRPDMVALRQYLDGREAVRAVLASREKHSLTDSDFQGTGPNADIAAAWSAFTGALVERNIVFGSIYSRYLERDDLTKVAK